MIYRILNKIIERRVEKLRPVAIRFLNKDLDGPGKESSIERLDVDKKYLRLIDYFKKDSKRRYMVNRNYLSFLKAVIYLYRTSSASVQAGILMAPSEVYGTINLVKNSFDETISHLNI